MERRMSTELKKTADNKSRARLYCIRNKVVVIMRENCRFSFTGKLQLKVVYGSVEIYGSIITVNDKTIEIYSPRGYSNVAIQTNAQSHGTICNQDVRSRLNEEGISCDTKNKFVHHIDQLQPGEAVIVLSDLKNRLTNFLDTFYSSKLFPKIERTSSTSWTDIKRAERILQSHLYFDSTSCKDLLFDSRLNEVTEKVLNQWRAGERSCTLIAGGKGVGKSTTVRYLINTILPASGKVVLLDIDPGQAECTPPACISYSVIDQALMGPNFTHLTTPVYQLYIGDVNVARCITRYVEGVKMLVDKLSSCPILSKLPIIVNTMGFPHGIGWDIILFTIKLIQPSLVVQIMSNRTKNNYPEFLDPEVVDKQQLLWTTWYSNILNWNTICSYELLVLESQAERKNVSGIETWNIEPYQRREFVMISYLSQMVQYSEDAESQNDGYLSLNKVVPYAAPFSSISILIPDTCVPPSQALSVINGTIVALCGIDSTTDETVTNETPVPMSSVPRLLTRAPLGTCYGFGIVRGVDMEKKEVFINTPLSASIMSHVNCLVGCIPVPGTLLQLNYLKNVPYTAGTDVLPTSREPRRGYFRMRYQNA